MPHHRTHRVAAYAAAVLMMVGGGVVAKFLDTGAGAALVAAGAFLAGKLGSQLFGQAEAAKKSLAKE